MWTRFFLFPKPAKIYQIELMGSLKLKMKLLRQWPLILFALILSGGRLAASEQRDFAAAAAAFQDGMWSRAESEFSDFIKKYPTSARVPEAALIQAQSDFNQGKVQAAIALLQAHETAAGALGDQYAYWIGQAQFTNADYQAAIATFAGLADTFTNSPWRLDAVINEAAAQARLANWGAVANSLQAPGGIFQQASKTNAADSRVLNGWLLLAQALLAENHPDSATAVLQPSPAFRSKPELDWRRLYLLCQAQIAAGKLSEAFASSSDLIDAANRTSQPNLRAQSIAMQAGALEKLGRLSDAESIYAENLTNSVPDTWQRQAVLKIAELSAKQTNFLNAENWLEDFQGRFTNSPEMDSVVLALGELRLKSYAASPSITNDDLSQAQSDFDQFINTFTNSPLLGKAYLDRGWCFWIEHGWSESASDFQAAVKDLPPSVDLAVAQFKLADAQFKEGDFSNALENYQAVSENFKNFPAVTMSLAPEALYQALRVSIQEGRLPDATNAVDQILKVYPGTTVAEKSLLIEGQAFSDIWNNPSEGRALLQMFEQKFPGSGQLPDIELAIAQTYERENNWPMAISTYKSWLKRFPDDVKLLPDVKYAQAWATFTGGYETNAFILFTNFLAEFPSNALWTPVAQWWLGDYYASQGEWADAERNYETIYDNWPSSSLAYSAVLMAGRAATGRQGYEQAKDYFLKIMGETNVPPQFASQPEQWYSLDAQACFAFGDVLMQEPSSDTNNPLANFKQAILYFQLVCNQYAGSEQSALAYGEIGDCYLQLATQSPQYYDEATNAYWNVVNSPGALAPERSKAQLAIGLVFEKRAALDPQNQTALLQSALDNYLDVFWGNNLRNGETADPFWVREAGLRALPLIQTLGQGDPNKFIDQMETCFPQMKDLLEKKRLEISRPKIQ